MKYFPIYILFTLMMMFSRDTYSISCHEGVVYFLDGFDKMLTLYGSDGTEIKKISLKNISNSGYFDNYIKYDKYLSYLTDTVNKTVFLLDENYDLKKSSEIVLPENEGFYENIFPSGYNSIILASEDRTDVYSLTSNNLKQIITFQTSFNDLFVDRSKIYILFREKFSVFETNGIPVRTISLSSEYDQIFADGGTVLLSSPEKISVINLDVMKQDNFQADKRSLPFLLNNEPYFFAPETKVFKRISNE